MTDGGIIQPVLQGAVALGLILAAAKSHGRQLRLERTQAGHPEADFRGGNHAWVETLWRNDRIGFWSTFVVLAAGVLVWSVGSTSLGSGAFLGRLVLGLAWAFAGAFTAMGVWSLWRLAEQDEAGWKSNPIGTSFLWWTLVALLFGLSAGLGR